MRALSSCDPEFYKSEFVIIAMFTYQGKTKISNFELKMSLNFVEISKVNRKIVYNGHIYIDVMKQHVPRNT